MSPFAPFVKIRQGVTPKQPDEAVLRIATAEPSQGVDGEACTSASLEIADADPRVVRHRNGSGKAGFEWRHIPGALLERIARRNEPPDFIEVQGTKRLQADVPMPPVRRVERAAKEADARHTPALACRLKLA